MKINKKLIKIKVLLLIIIHLIFLIISCSFIKEYDNVFIIYLDGANNLDQFALNDFNEMKNLSSKYIEKLNNNSIILVLFDRMYNNIPSYNDWEDTRLYEIKYKDKGVSEVNEIDCPDLGLTTLYIDEDCDMGNAKTLARLCSFALNNYPAKRYFLDIWNHGGGWRKNKQMSDKEICSDEESESVIKMIDIRNELNKISSLHFALIILDACFMGTIEVAANFIGLTDAIVFSQGPIPANGMPYDIIIPCILSSENLRDIAKNICDEYVLYYTNLNENVTISSCFVDYENRLDNFCKELVDEIMTFEFNEIRNKRENYLEFSQTCVDISVFTSISTKLQENLINLVLYNYPSTLSGLSIYFPKYPLYDKYWEDYKIEEVYFCSRYSKYINFLNNFSMTYISNIDTFEPNGKKENSYNLSFPVNIESYIWCENDLDYYKLLNIPVNEFKIRLLPPAGHDYDIKIYYYINDSLSIQQSTNSGDTEEEIIIDKDIASKIEELYIVVVGAQSDFCQDNSYNLIVQ
ncbi:MAG: clostripain-related cysteine peptidase [Spirochaetota bacterium]